MDASSLLALPTSPASSGLQVFALFINFFFPALALVVVSVRVAGRAAASQFAADDWLICIAMLMSVAETVISFFFIKANFIGIPAEQVPPHDPTHALIWTYAVQILYNPILALVKSSVLIFLTRLFGQRDWIRRFLLWLNVVNISQMVAVFFAIVLQCTPVSFNWDPTVPGGYCVDRRVLYISTAVFNIVTDILILGLPLWVFSSLRIPKRTKIALLVVFTLGFLVTITSIIRLVILVQGLFMVPIFPNSASNNVGFVTSAIETNLALITASAPALRPIFRSRDRGGWFARSVMATTRGAPDNNPTATSKKDSYDPDVETGQKPLGWDKETTPIIANTNSTPAASKFGRGGSRGGRKTSSTRRLNPSSRSRGSGSKTNKIKPTIIRIQRVATEYQGSGPLAELRSSPRSSEEQAMTENGLVTVRVSDIQREIDGIVKDIAVAGRGTYTGAGSITTPSSTGGFRPATPKTPPRPPAPGFTTTTAATLGGSTRPTTPKTPRTPSSSTARARSRPSMETITVGATLVTPLPPPPRPSTSGSSSTGGISRRTAPPERYYSASIYPAEQGDAEKDDEGWDDDDRVSRYLDRRFGVVTPRGTTPTGSSFRGWEGGGRPF